MRGHEVLPFESSMLPGAAALLARRHGEELQAEPALDTSFEEHEFAERYLRRSMDNGAFGLAALDGSEVVGYLLVVEEDDDREHRVWSSAGWQGAVDQNAQQILASLYGASAVQWVGRRIAHHFCVIPANDGPGLRTWSHLGFAIQQEYAIRETRPATNDYPFTVRRANSDDIDLLAPALGLIAEAHRAAPVFAYIPSSFDENLRQGHLELLNDEGTGYFLASEGQRLLGYSVVESIGDGITPMVPRGAVSLSVAATLASARGRGVQRALTDAILGWAHERGHETCVTDWRAANPDSSRAWPRLGFRTTGYRLHRMLDPRVLPAKSG